VAVLGSGLIMKRRDWDGGERERGRVGEGGEKKAEW
jgi:hypothetical protein